MLKIDSSKANRERERESVADRAIRADRFSVDGCRCAFVCVWNDKHFKSFAFSLSLSHTRSFSWTLSLSSWWTAFHVQIFWSWNLATGQNFCLFIRLKNEIINRFNSLRRFFSLFLLQPKQRWKNHFYCWNFLKYFAKKFVNQIYIQMDNKKWGKRCLVSSIMISLFDGFYWKLFSWILMCSFFRPYIPCYIYFAFSLARRTFVYNYMYMVERWYAWRYT